jgi:hypothetical protein
LVTYLDDARGEWVEGWRSDFIAECSGPGPRGGDRVYHEYVPSVCAEVCLVDLPSWSAVRDQRSIDIQWAAPHLVRPVVSAGVAVGRRSTTGAPASLSDAPPRTDWRRSA